jgi:glycerol kinase
MRVPGGGDRGRAAVDRLVEHELTGLGAAGLAGLEAGVWTRDELAAAGPADAFEPEGEAAFLDRYESAFEAARALDVG